MPHLHMVLLEPGDFVPVGLGLYQSWFSQQLPQPPLLMRNNLPSPPALATRIVMGKWQFLDCARYVDTELPGRAWEPLNPLQSS